VFGDPERLIGETSAVSETEGKKSPLSAQTDKSLLVDAGDPLAHSETDA